MRASVQGFTIHLANFSIGFSSGTDTTHLEINNSVVLFATTKPNCDLHYNVQVFDFIPEMNSCNELLFSSTFPAPETGEKNEFKWEVHQDDFFYRLTFYHQRDPECPICVFTFSETLRDWDIYFRNTQERTSNYFDPLLHPFGSFVMYYASLFSNSYMIHASGVEFHDKGYLFAGFSGAGKSTMSGIWRDACADLIHDDRLMLSFKDNHLKMYNTPIYSGEQPKSGNVDAIFLIYHSTGNRIQKLSGAQAVSRLFAFCIQHDFNTDWIDRMLGFVTEASGKVPVYELGFVPDSSIIEFFNNHV